MSPAKQPADAFERLRECAWQLNKLVRNNTTDQETNISVTISSEDRGFWEVLTALKMSPSLGEYGVYPDLSGDLTVFGVDFKFERKIK